MIIVDAHCDTLTKIMEDNSNLFNNRFHADIERMQKSDNYVQFFAAFIDPEYDRVCSLKRAMQIIDKFYRQISLFKDHVELCLNYKDVDSTLKKRKVAAILSIEGGEALQGDLDILRIFYRLGVRSICLTWNFRNEIADGIKDEISGGGLTAFGRKVVKEMNSLGMIVDLSHISERGFWDVLEIADSPLIVSHSNAKKICSHNRNLSDEQIEAVKKNGGVIGINLYPFFLNNSGNASLKDVIKHIEHIVSLTGYDHIGLGSDFDGIECTPLEIKGVQDIYRLFEELEKLNYPGEFIEKFAGKNFLRVICQVLK
jgi:membrane dipeptidase